MSKTHTLRSPPGEADVRKLRVGDFVLLTGDIVMTAGLPTHHRIVECMEGKRELPVPLQGAAFFHLGSYSKESADGSTEILYMNPTTSTRFNPLMPRMIRHYGLRAVGGKGGLDRASTEAMKETGCVYLAFLGGGVPLHSAAIEGLVAVGWQDLVSHYRLVQLRVRELGPLVVAIDAHGNNAYESLHDQAEERLPSLLAEIDRARR